MKKLLQNGVRAVLSTPFIARLPVKVKSGVAQGAHWTLYPWTSYWRGTHEPESQQLVSKLMDWTGKSVWDLGSHFGLFAVGLGRRVGPTGAVAAFEPHPINFARLRLHAQRNHLSWVHVFQRAVSDHAGTDRLLIYQDQGATTTGHLAYEGETLHDGIEAHDITLVRLDDWVLAGKIRPPDFIKMDVEGHGHHALAGAKATIEKYRPVILMGFHSPEEVEQTEKLLLPLGYTFSPVTPFVGSSRIGRDYLLKVS